MLQEDNSFELIATKKLPNANTLSWVLLNKFKINKAVKVKRWG